jgi:hypothetical protein
MKETKLVVVCAAVDTDTDIAKNNTNSTEHHAMEEYWGSGCISPFILSPRN